MKQIKIGLVLIICMLLFPFSVKAEVVKENLESVLKKEEIQYDLSEYYEDDNQIPIYLFYGDGCGYCKKLLTYLNSIVPEYGKYFKLVAYEVWDNSDNAELMQDVAKFLNKDANGVPFYIIGNESFVGYGESYNEKIKNAITALYNSDERYDVFQEMENSKKEEPKKEEKSGSSTSVILWNAAITGIAAVSIIIYERSQYNKLVEKIDKIDKNANLESKQAKKEKGKK